MLVVSLLLYAELFPEFDADDALSFLFALLDVLLWVWFWDCWLLRVLVLVLLPELETPDVDFELPPVADAPEVEPDVEPDVAPEVEPDDAVAPDVVVVGEVVGVDGGVGVDGTQIKAIPCTTV